MNSSNNCHKRLTDIKDIQCASIGIPSVKMPPNALSEIFAQAASSGYLTVADRDGLKAALLDESLSSEERAAIDRLLYAVRKGRLRLVDEIATEIQDQTLGSNEWSQNGSPVEQSLILTRRIADPFLLGHYVNLEPEMIRQTA
jgi:hypothetical protein